MICDKNSSIEFPSNEYFVKELNVKPDKIELVINNDIPEIVINGKEEGNFLVQIEFENKVTHNII